MEQFREGDIVQLKSGGPNMTVSSTDIKFGSKAPYCRCQWFSGTTLSFGDFEFDTLKKVELEVEKNY